MAEISMANSFNSLGIGSRYILRSTGKEVEVVASNLVENGSRSDKDWVSYIDSEGKEHIKEPLNIQFDFKAHNAWSEIYSKFLECPKYPSAENTRIFDVAKELIAHKSYSIDDAINTAKELVSKVREIEV